VRQDTSAEKANELNIDSRIILVIQLLMLITLGVGGLGFELHFFRQIIGFIYLTFVPGYLLLKILKSHGSDKLETILYSVGLSIAFIMFVGLSINALYPLIGITKPISTFPLTITLTILVLALWALGRNRNAGALFAEGAISSRTLSLPALFLFSLPSLSILGTVLIALYGNNILMILVIAMIPIVPVLVATGKFIPSRLYAFAVVAIAIALLLQYPLVSKYLTGVDIHAEYYYSSLVIQKSYWDSTLSGNINAMASIVILSPIYSIVLNLDNVWVFKIVYPLLFSLVPLGLYCVYQKLVTKKLAFLSVFFFMSFATFFTEMTALNRQEIAELFLVLIILLALDKKMKPAIGVLLSTVFAGGLIISHYGLTYITMLTYLGLALVVWLIIEKLPLRHLFGCMRGWKKSKVPNIEPMTKPRIVTGTFILTFLVIALSWYTFVSSSTLIWTIAYEGEHIWNGLLTQFLNLGARDISVQLALGGPSVTASLFRDMQRILQYITEFFIIAGVLGMILTRNNIRKGAREFFVWTIASMILLILSIALPFFASALNMTRIYHVTLFFLSLLCVLGGIASLRKLLKVFRKSEAMKFATALLVIVLVCYFFFNTGLIYEITGDVPTSASLGFQRLKEITGKVRVWFDSFYIYDEEVASAQWLSAHRDNAGQVFADVPAAVRVLLSYGMIPPEKSLILYNDTEIPKGAYVYLRRLNVIDGLIVSYSALGYGPNYVFNISDISPVLERSDIVYQNGASSILRSP
jgi:uncharacterized membrane protein